VLERIEARRIDLCGKGCEVAAASERARTGTGARQFILRLLLAVLALAPVGVLFVEVRQSATTRISAADRERQGIQYVTALGPLTVALADAQSAAVQGTGGGTAALAQAVEGVTAVDDRLGTELGTRDRWHDLQAKIASVTGQSDEPVGAYADYGAVTDLLLSLYTRVRETSGLIHDQGADTYYLQDGASGQLPRLIVAAGRMVDQATLAVGRPAADALRTTAELLNAVSDTNRPAADTVEDVQRAVDGTQGPTLNTDLVSQLDTFRVAIDALSSSTVLVDGSVTKADVAASAGLRAAIVTAAANLSATVLTRIDQGISDRIAADRQTLQIAELAAALAVLLLLLPVLLALVGWRRRPGAVELVDDPSVELTALPALPVASQWGRVGAPR
jgi:hypothetical protein